MYAYHFVLLVIKQYCENEYSLCVLQIVTDFANEVKHNLYVARGYLLNRFITLIYVRSVSPSEPLNDWC